MAPGKDPQQEGTRQSLLEAALLCFAERGFDGTSMRMVAQRAGKNISLIAHHFGNKEGLYLEVFRYLLESQHPKSMDRPFVSVETLQGDRPAALALFRTLIRDGLNEAHEAQTSPSPLRAAAFQLWFTEMRSPRPVVLALVKEHGRSKARQTRACLQALRPDLAEDEITFWGTTLHGLCVVSLLLRGFHQATWGACEHSGRLEWVEEQLFTMALRGLGIQEP
jgi:AcrR family transcriptional regulator